MNLDNPENLSSPRENLKTGRAAELIRKLEYDLCYDPLRELVKLSNGTKDPSRRDVFNAKIAMEILGYRYPKLKALEMNANQGEIISVNITFPEDVAKEIKNTSARVSSSDED